MLDGKDPLPTGQQMSSLHITHTLFILLYMDVVSTCRAREQGMLWTNMYICMWQSAHGTWCRQHAARYEKEFLEDMDSLGCRRPDVMTRVSEYMTEIVDYIQTIMDNKMAYESSGSVHFDTQAFRYMHVLVCRLQIQCM